MLGHENPVVASVPGRDHIDRWLAEHAAELPDIDLTVEGIVDRIFGLRRRLQKTMDVTLGGLGLTWDDFKVLGSLRTGPERRRTAGDLARKLEVTSGSMTNRIDRLESAGLVRRLPNPADRRGVLVEMTPDGLAAWQRAVELQAAREQEIANAALDRADLEHLNDLLRRVMLVFEATEGSEAESC